jgi:hypothetical protein
MLERDIKESEALHWAKEVITQHWVEEEQEDTLWGSQIWTNIAMKMRISLKQLTDN